MRNSSKHSQESKRFRNFLVVLSILGSLVVYFATSSLGAGLGEDSAKYLSAAQSLAEGKGLLVYNGDLMTHWPPVYPGLLAAFHLLLGLDVHQAGWLLNIALFGACIWLSGLLFARGFGSGSGFAYAGPALVFTSVALVSAAVNISSDPLFMVVALLFLLRGHAYLEQPTPKNLVWLGLWAVVGVFTRYAGFGLIIAGGLLAFEAPSGSFLRRTVRAGLFGLLSATPIMIWAYLRNYSEVGRFFGRQPLFSAPVQNLLLIPEKVAGWFVPELVLQYIPPLWLVLGFALLLLLLSRAATHLSFFRSLGKAEALPHAAFLIGYFFVLVFSSSYYELRNIGFDRIHVIMLPSLLYITFLAVQQLPARVKERVPAAHWRGILLVIFAGLLVFTGYRMQKYVRAVWLEGDRNYNFINTPALRQSALVSYLETLDPDAEQFVYSNNEALVWFYLRRPVDRPAIAYQQGRGYVVWFTGSLDYKSLPLEIAEEDLQLLFEDEFGVIYRFNPSG